MARKAVSQLQEVLVAMLRPDNVQGLERNLQGIARLGINRPDALNVGRIAVRIVGRTETTPRQCDIAATSILQATVLRLEPDAVAQDAHIVRGHNQIGRMIGAQLEEDHLIVIVDDL